MSDNSTYALNHYFEETLHSLFMYTGSTSCVSPGDHHDINKVCEVRRFDMEGFQWPMPFQWYKRKLMFILLSKQFNTYTVSF